MTETDRIRPEVVDAIVVALTTTDPAGLPADATRAEKDAAQDLFFTRTAAERGLRDRQSRAWELLLTRNYDEPPTWARLFDDLPVGAETELGELYDALPEGAQVEYARRHGAPAS
ncbi:hypothetical protein SAMN05660199_02673 [Klenkia soli]|uniref:Uncharacterized protein n=1 Tax=Klenkia soli TaxID=1052260 RepID=A0A1H0MYC5_9ACTN|nr:hypothetical protein [Klenkia soli]SDO85285.1 hypothetical protein SAMN05660199_02673 [Klenkia soli]